MYQGWALADRACKAMCDWIWHTSDSACSGANVRHHGDSEPIIGVACASVCETVC